MNPAAAQRERILDAWAAGAKGDTIAKAERVRRHDIYQIVKVARDVGDPRARSREDHGNTNVVNAHEFYSRSDLVRFDLAFKTALLAAIAAGKERAEVGVYKAAPKKVRS